MGNNQETESKINYTGVLFQQTFIEILQLVRTPLYLFGIFLFPSLIVFFPSTQNSAQLILVFFSALMLLIVSVERLGKRIATERIEGWQKLIQVSPLPPSIFLRAKIIVTLLISISILFLMFIFGKYRWGIDTPLIDWLSLFFCLILGIIPFAIFGIAMGYLFNPKSVDSILGLLIPMALLSCGLPLSDAEWFKIILDFSPFYHYGQLILSSANIKDINSDGNLIFHIAYLLIFSLFFYFFAIWAYKRDQSLS